MKLTVANPKFYHRYVGSYPPEFAREFDSTRIRTTTAVKIVSVIDAIVANVER